jgi:hypothetical protein
MELFLLSEMTSPNFMFSLLNIFFTGMKDFSIWEYGRKKGDR